MSATFPTRDDLRIPARPRLIRPAPRLMALQLVGAALAGFGLAWTLTGLLVG